MESTNGKLRVLAVGATGPSAGLVVPELLKRGVFVRGFIHKREDEQAARTLGLHDVVVGELSETAAVEKALQGIDAAFYVAPAALDNEAEVGKAFVAAARQAGVRRVVF